MLAAVGAHIHAIRQNVCLLFHEPIALLVLHSCTFMNLVVLFYRTLHYYMTCEPISFLLSDIIELFCRPQCTIAIIVVVFHPTLH